MFTSSGPTFRELAVQALSSVERGYDLLAPKFDHTPYRTPAPLLDAVGRELSSLGPFRAGLDVCCGTGAATAVLRELCTERVTGVDLSTGMLARARAALPPELSPTPSPTEPSPTGPPGAEPAPPRLSFVRADARALPFAAAFDLAVSFGAFGHFLPAEHPALFAGIHRALRPGGLFAFPLPAPPPVGSREYARLWAFDAAMRVRNSVWRPPFVMYYRTFRLAPVTARLRAAGFAVETRALAAAGRRPDGAPRCRLVLARRPG
ncbi:class I SAM-dependent methyltransferase [Streptomyces yaizuensis]|uniref:Class I SAM-dependent methyltransferase n=1 Tax=Streptomyces yaizuensis TaxID=2989713 RepID=A0ABQ5P5Q3_9ACTN|nr:methyltransferase domain-containing protein [Streptomyces sp. YSPA8]GLF97904.1 class I SAM-dependent methyltransferase [Streptomyces sp. YSPA8]